MLMTVLATVLATGIMGTGVVTRRPPDMGELVLSVGGERGTKPSR